MRQDHAIDFHHRAVDIMHPLIDQHTPSHVQAKVAMAEVIGSSLDEKADPDMKGRVLIA